MEHALIPLSMLHEGEIAEIHSVTAETRHGRRLRELGLREGVPVEMVRAGSPCILRLNDTKLCFRDDDLSSILVRMMPVA